VTSLSQDVAKRLREGTVTERTLQRSTHDNYLRVDESSRSCLSDSHYDPLHLPSLVMLTVSLVGPLRARLRRSLSLLIEAIGDSNVRSALLGGFIVGMGVGLFVKFPS